MNGASDFSLDNRLALCADFVYNFSQGNYVQNPGYGDF